MTNKQEPSRYGFEKWQMIVFGSIGTIAAGGVTLITTGNPWTGIFIFNLSLWVLATPLFYQLLSERSGGEPNVE